MSIRAECEGSVESRAGESTPRQQNPQKLFDWALLPLLMIGTPLLFFFRTQYNLPLAANVDERTALDIFQRFQSGTLNPHNFLYPTLYYYITYFFTKLFTPSMVLVGGRILNLSFVGLTSYLAYSFCRIYLLSRTAGILSALFIITSPTIVNSGSYICTDVLLAAAILASLLFLVRYFQQTKLRNWLVAMILVGVAVGSKYTALLLFFAYAITEMIREVRKEGHAGSESEPRVPRSVLSPALACLGCLFLTAAWLFPLSDLMRFASAHHTNPDLRSPAEYLVFFHQVRKILVWGAAALAALALLVRWEYPYRLLSLRRLYLGLAMVLLVAALTTPYSILDPSKFTYDLGAQARATVMLQSAEAQWQNYYLWLGSESKVLLILGLLGFFTVAVPNYRVYLVVVVFAVLYVFSIGSAHIGFPRYLTPILPLLFVLAAGFLVKIGNLQRWGSLQPARILALLLLSLAAGELWPRFESSRIGSKRTDEFWNSYNVAMNSHVAKVLYAGSAPFAELNAAGVPTSRISWVSLGAKPMGDQLACGELLIFDRRAAEAHRLAPESDASVTILLDDRLGDYGQEVLRRADCQ